MDISETDIINFINRFTNKGKNQGTIETFTQGCCYWFALILRERFYCPRETELMYDQIENHFGCRIGEKIYDITGDVTHKYNWQTWLSLFDEDRLLVKRIFRDCINF